MYVVQDGLAEVYLTDEHGTEQLLNRVGAGGTLGEMALFTGQPASATVRAMTDVDALICSPGEFDLIASQLPGIYRNLGAILARRLGRTNSRWLRTSTSRITLLHDHGAPPLLGYALACSVAWHTRKPTLFIAVSPDLSTELVDMTSDAPGPTLPLAR